MPDSFDDDQIAATETQIAEQTKRIEFYLTEYSVELLATKMREGEFVIPAYQREFTWDPGRKSRFIESVIMGLPIPFLFFWERPDDGRLEVVDGSQRLRTIEEFVFGDLKLGTLETLDQLSGMRFQDLLESRRRKVMNRSIRGIVLNENADEQARLDIFDRINTGSKNANKAEIRRGILQGPFMDLVVDLSISEPFVSLSPMSKQRVDEREREELVARFFAYGDGLEKYRDRPAQFVFDYTRSMNKRFEADPSLAAAYRTRFSKTMSFVKDSFPYGFARNAGGKATPRARFEAIAIGSWMALCADPDLVPGDTSNWLEAEGFKRVAGSDGANAIARLRERIDFVRRHLMEEDHDAAS